MRDLLGFVGPHTIQVAPPTSTGGPSSTDSPCRDDASACGRDELLTRLDAFADVVRDDHFYDAVDVEAEVSMLTDRWADLGDEINYREGYPFLTEESELRDKLMTSGRETFDAASRAEES